jgi:phosphotriesterase-related protein
MERITVTAVVHTVLGPVAADSLGVIAVHEALLSVLPGAEYAFDITLDRAEIFETLRGLLVEFRANGGGTVVDSTGMFHGRDLPLYEALARATGVHIVASTGLGPEELLGGYFLTPQTNPPTPWPADRFAALFTREITEGMTVARVERRSPAGLIATATSRAGTTPTDESLLRGAARAALATGVAVSVRFGADALRDLDILVSENLPTRRIVIGGLDRRDAVSTGAHLEVARRGSFVAIDHIGIPDDEHVADAAALVSDLVAAGHTDRILLSSNSIGVAKGTAPRVIPLSGILVDFVPALAARGVSDDDIRLILESNPRALLTVGN